MKNIHLVFFGQAFFVKFTSYIFLFVKSRSAKFHSQHRQCLDFSLCVASWARNLVCRDSMVWASFVQHPECRASVPSGDLFEAGAGILYGLRDFLGSRTLPCCTPTAPTVPHLTHYRAPTTVRQASRFLWLFRAGYISSVIWFLTSDHVGVLSHPLHTPRQRSVVFLIAPQSLRCQ